MKVGLIGLGRMGLNHLRVLSQSKSVTEIFAFDLNPSARAPVDKEINCSSLEQLISQELDYAVVALPTSAHLDASIALAARQVPTLLEKPVALSLSEAREIQEAFKLNQTFCAVGFVERFNAALSMLRIKFNEGLIGKPLQVSTQRFGPFPRRITDVGVALDLASHDLDIVNWVLGSEYANLSLHVSAPLGGENEDALLGVGVLENGALVSHEVNWISPFKKRETRILGEGGMLVADSLRAELRLYENGDVGSEWSAFANFRGVTEGEVTQFVVPVKEPLILEHEAMIREIENPGSSEIASLQDGMRVMQTLDKAMV